MIIKDFILFFRYNKRIALRTFLNHFLLRRWIIKNKYFLSEKNRKIEKIIFLVGAPKGVINLRGIQPSIAINRKGINSRVQVKKLPRDIDDKTLIIFVKYFPFSEVVKAIKKNCILLYDIVDENKPFFLENEGKLCNGVIFSNKKMVDDFKPLLSKNTKSFIIYHHWDSRFKVPKRNNKELSLAYFGAIPEKNALHFDKFNIPVISNFSDHLKKAKRFNCFYSIRKKDSIEFLYKPSTKVSTAAGIGANIITSKEPSAVELLGEDYPYLTDSDFESVKKTIEYAKETFGKKIWKDALKTMEKVRKRTDINRIADDYIKMINSL
jgi:hypothetical protein